MFLRATKRFKDGKAHCYWSLVESVRVGRRVFQRQVLYLGELNDSQRAEWQRTVEAFDENGKPQQMKLFPENRAPGTDDDSVVRMPRPATSSSLTSRARTSRSTERRLSKANSGVTATAATNAAAVFRSWSLSSLRPTDSPSPTRSCPATRTTAKLRCRSSRGSRRNAAGSAASGRWPMDRGIPTEKTLKAMREGGYKYLVGAPR